MTTMAAEDVRQLVARLDAAKAVLPRRSFGQCGMVIHRSSDVAEEAEYLASVGLVGFLPIGKYCDGDQVALRPLPGRSLDDWPVMRCLHGGGGAVTIARRASRWVAVIAATDEAEDCFCNERAPLSDEIDAAGRFFGDDGLAGEVARSLADGRLSMAHEHVEERLLAAEPDGLRLALRKAQRAIVIDRAEPGATVEALIEGHHDSPAPSWLALRAGDPPRARSAARRLLLGPLAIDFPRARPDLWRPDLPIDDEDDDAFERLTGVSFGRKTDPWKLAAAALTADDHDATPAGQILGGIRTAGRLDADLLRAAARRFEEVGEIEHALTTFENASWLHHSDTEQSAHDALEGAARCACKLGPAIAAVYALAGSAGRPGK